jgi:hypothetical protein
MRDDPMDAQIPEQFEPSDYYRTKANEANQTLDNLLAMHDVDKLVFGAEAKAKQVGEYEAWLVKDAEQNKRLEEMEAKVKAWTPPSPDHQGVKDFMLQQIETSKNDLDWIKNLLQENRTAPEMRFYNDAVTNARNEIISNAVEQNKENKRAKDRDHWVRQLRESIAAHQ